MDKTKSIKEIQNCNSCGDELEEEEIESPRKDKDGSILCDECYEDKYQHHCPVCEEFFYEDLEAKISPKYLMILPSVGENVGLDAGIYEIVSYPFFADGIIELHIYKSAVKWICDIPSDIEDCYTLYYICDDCKTKLEQNQQESDIIWSMRWM